MRRAAVTLAVLLAAGASAATVAWAVSIPDRDDVTTGIDIARTIGAHNRFKDQLVHVVDAYEPFTPAGMLNKGRPPSSVCVEIWTTNRPGESAPNYEACATPDARGKRWKASVARLRLRGPRLRVGAVKVEQPGPTRIVLRIDPDDVRRPAAYRWRSETTSFGADCKRASGCQDSAPDSPRTATTRLGRPRR